MANINFDFTPNRCQDISHPITSPSAYALGSTTVSITRPAPTGSRPVPSVLCQSTYEIQENDTCQSISYNMRVSTFLLVYANKLPSHCTDFPSTGTSLCIPQSCDVYKVSGNERCATVALIAGVNTSQLVEWNRNINDECTNLPSLKGLYICIRCVTALVVWPSEISLHLKADVSLQNSPPGSTTDPTTSAPAQPRLVLYLDMSANVPNVAWKF